MAKWLPPHENALCGTGFTQPSLAQLYPRGAGRWVGSIPIMNQQKQQAKVKRRQNRQRQYTSYK
jgi:hypothetical protein